MRTKSFWGGLLMMMSASLANAAPILPSGLAPGSTYFLAFVTAGEYQAISSNIAVYDALVTAEANQDPILAALGTTWKIIGSTATVDAIDHIGVTGPVYNLGGLKVADGSLDMFDGSLDAPLKYDQHGNLRLSFVWTGSIYTGIGAPEHELGSDQRVVMGLSSDMGMEWLSNGQQIDPFYFTHSLYGISGPLEAPTAVPEPSTISLMLGPLLLLCGTHRRWRHLLATRTMRADPAFH